MKINLSNIHDDYLDNLPLKGKISPTVCLGENVRTMRPYCSCCGGSMGVRAGFYKLHRHVNPKDSEEFFMIPRPWYKFAKRKSYKPKLKKHKRDSIRYKQTL